jgi:Lsr2
MASKTTIVLEDDLEGGPADETLRFSLGGKDYEIDLNTKNASLFRRQLATFVDHARPAGAGQSRRPARTASSRKRSAAIRAWAKEQGIAVSDRGRIPATVIEQYQAAPKAH